MYFSDGPSFIDSLEKAYNQTLAEWQHCLDNWIIKKCLQGSRAAFYEELKWEELRLEKSDEFDASYAYKNYYLENFEEQLHKLNEKKTHEVAALLSTNFKIKS